MPQLYVCQTFTSCISNFFHCQTLPARRYFQPGTAVPLTPRVVTLWYRAPELLMGCNTYGPAIDAWSAGCILGELLRHTPLFPARSELELMHMIAQLLGSPTPESWPGLAALPLAREVRWPRQPVSGLRAAFPGLSESGLDLLRGLLAYDPSRRLTARQALEHHFFRVRRCSSTQSTPLKSAVDI